MKPALLPRRNELVWVDERAWRKLCDAAWDAEARSLIRHWSERRLPLVVACDRLEAAASGQLCVGLPAPLRWSRRRLALTVGSDSVQAIGGFPTLHHVARVLQWGADALELAERLAACGTVARVYGSHGWQVLSGEACVSDGSDVDLIIEVQDIEQARAALPLLQSARLAGRIDGEFSFPDGHALAWRELARADQGLADRVLLKSRSGARLVAYATGSGMARQEAVST